LGNKMKMLACLVIALVAISRITLAMHYPADIIYSCLLAVIVIMLGNFIYDKFKEILIRPIGRIIVRVIFSKK
jgi:membrane-associated phospholipid phosphatase